jgi:hypothetical protein
MLGVSPEIKKKWAIETHFPEFKWIIYDFNNNRNNTQKTISKFESGNAPGLNPLLDTSLFYLLG